MQQRNMSRNSNVAPHVGAWIETHLRRHIKAFAAVAPHVGAWIETIMKKRDCWSAVSHPMWVRGLKQSCILLSRQHVKSVAPHVGAWIETVKLRASTKYGSVAPHVGAWIETFGAHTLNGGLSVAPHVGAWIETAPQESWRLEQPCRTPCGCVD